MEFKIAFKNLPFIPKRRQVIYVESSYNEAVNKFIQKNYKSILRDCNFMGLDFCYIPRMKEEFDASSVLSYNAPYAKVKTNPTEIGSDFLLNFMLHPENKSKVPPSLLYIEYDENDEEDERLNEDEVVFSGVSITEMDICDEGIFNYLLNIIHDNSDCQIFYRDGDDNIQCYIKYNADQFFDEETQKLATEVWEKIRELEKKGFTWYMLQQFIEGKEKLSRLLITRDFRILLPDYNNMEIEMTPLPKAVFILFLRHPEGIVFKCLPDYKEELKEIYLKMKPAGWTSAVEQSIEALTDPFNNSINEKCARIREAFVGNFKEHLAENYFVTGKRGEPKLIKLPRDLVIWDR